jgi:hypothetical protein
MLIGVALLVVALMATACGGGGQAPAPTQPAAQATAPGAATQPAAQPQATQPPAQGGAKPLDLPAGVDADGNFYLGDANAPVKLEEWSDFQ